MRGQCVDRGWCCAQHAVGGCLGVCVSRCKDVGRLQRHVLLFSWRRMQVMQHVLPAAARTCEGVHADVQASLVCVKAQGQGHLLTQLGL